MLNAQTLLRDPRMETSGSEEPGRREGGRTQISPRGSPVACSQELTPGLSLERGGIRSWMALLDLKALSGLMKSREDAKGRRERLEHKSINKQKKSVRSIRLHQKEQYKNNGNTRRRGRREGRSCPNR